MFRELWRAVRTAFLVVGVALVFFACVEVVQAFETLYGLHPLVGYAFAAVLAAGITGAGVRYALTVFARPVVVPPHVRPDLMNAGAHEVRSYAAHILRLLRRLSRNGNLGIDQRERITDGILMVEQSAAGWADRTQLAQTISRCEIDILQPAMDSLDDKARGEVRRCVRDVMVGVTLSPWRSVDLWVVVYRNLRMVLALVRIYNSRPRTREQFLILRDVLTVVATVNYLNLGSRLLQNLASGVPILGRFADDIAQGVGAGILTSVAGHAAVSRCGAVRAWDICEAEASIHAKLRTFMGDVKGIIADDIVPQLRRPVEEARASQVDRPAGGERLREGIGRALDETCEILDLCVRRPVVAAGRGVATTGTVLGGGVSAGVSAVGHGLVHAGGGLLRGSRRALGGASEAARSAGRRVGGVLRMSFRARKVARKPEDEDVSTDA